MIKPGSRVEQVTASLHSLIDRHFFENGRLPSEPALADMLGASRATVRQALERLARGGLIIRRHGVGTFVNQRVQSIGTRLEEVWDFAEMIRTSGHEASVQHVEMRLAPASPKEQEKLSLQPNSEVLSTANVFLADGIPVIYCLDVLPASLVTQAYLDVELQGPVYTFLENRCGQRVDYNITEVVPIVADARLSKLLGCQVGDPLHYFEEIGYNADDNPILYSEEYYRPEFFSFKVIRKMTTLKT